MFVEYLKHHMFTRYRTIMNYPCRNRKLLQHNGQSSKGRASYWKSFSFSSIDAKVEASFLDCRVFILHCVMFHPFYLEVKIGWQPAHFSSTVKQRLSRLAVTRCEGFINTASLMNLNFYKVVWLKWKWFIGLTQTVQFASELFLSPSLSFSLSSLWAAFHRVHIKGPGDVPMLVESGQLSQPFRPWSTQSLLP